MIAPPIHLLLLAVASWSRGIVAGASDPTTDFGQGPPEEAERFSVTARLRLKDGTSPGGATVLLVCKKHAFGFPMYAQERQADSASAAARFDDVPHGEYVLVARWQGERREPGPDAQLTPNPRALPPTTRVWWSFRDDVSPAASGYELILSEGITQTFVVRKPTGDPVEEVFMRLALKRGPAFPMPPDARAERIVTLARYARPADGRFDLHGLSPGEWSCVLSIPGHGRTEEISLAIPQDTEVEVTVRPFLSVSGEVYAPDGTPVRGAWVGIQYAPTHLVIPEDGQVATRTDEFGKFAIKDVRPGQARLKASVDREKYRFDTDLNLEPGKDLKGVRIDLTLRK